MWQLLLGAAVAGSTGFLARHLFNPHAHNPISHQTSICDDEPDEGVGQRDSFDNVKCSSFPGQSRFVEPGYESEYEKQKQDGIFRFSSSESGGKTGFRTGRRSLGKKVSKKDEKRSGAVVVCRRRFAVCLKRRRTAKNATYNCVSCSSRGRSAFGWGVGVGIMYMMSAGNAEIGKLNSAIDETAKVVQELKTELCKRKSSENLVASNPANVVTTSSKKVSRQHTQLALNKDPNNNILLGLTSVDDGECASSVLTEEPEQGPEDVEMSQMTQLEAELEAELQKLNESEVAPEKSNETGGQSSDAYPYGGVLPSELNQKLCHLLIEQQGSQIVELESDLHLAQSKLHEKEDELQALKDCVRRLTAMSLSTVSDDEHEAQEEQECTNEWRQQNEIGSESRKPSVGMKRPIEA
ncbi:hypothetical protein SLE2022_077080 [Rubroshorea leprosula]